MRSAYRHQLIQLIMPNVREIDGRLLHMCRHWYQSERLNHLQVYIGNARPQHLQLLDLNSCGLGTSLYFQVTDLFQPTKLHYINSNNKIGPFPVDAAENYSIWISWAVFICLHILKWVSHEIDCFTAIWMHWRLSKWQSSMIPVAVKQSTSSEN